VSQTEYRIDLEFSFTHGRESLFLPDLSPAVDTLQLDTDPIVVRRFGVTPDDWEEWEIPRVTLAYVRTAQRTITVEPQPPAGLT
jgi:hypothetical protein